jgi:hypothetical protein
LSLIGGGIGIGLGLLGAHGITYFAQLQTLIRSGAVAAALACAGLVGSSLAFIRLGEPHASIPSRP